jgi:hypothetical protein
MGLFNCNHVIGAGMRFLSRILPAIDIPSFIAHKHFKNIIDCYFTQNALLIANYATKLTSGILKKISSAEFKHWESF